MTGHTAVYAVLGRPVAHSRSPELHNAWFAHHGVDAVYVALDVPPERGPELGAALVTLGLAGVNLTVPHKAAILPALSEMDDVVAAVGAANTVVRRIGGLVGYNTDAPGFVRGFEAEFGPVAGRRAVVLGAGGAARAVGYGLVQAGASDVVFLNRTPSRAVDAADAVGGRAGRLDPRAFAEEAAGAGLVVNALTGPAASVVAALDPSVLDAHAVWCDLNYWMEEPPQRSRCRALGLGFQGGWPMLVHQAALAFEHFTGIELSPDELRRTLG